MYKKQSHNSHSSPKKALLITGAAVLVLLIAGGTVTYLNRDAWFGGANQTDEETLVEGSSAGLAVNDEAGQIAAAGQTDDAVKLLDESIQASSNNDEKAQLFAQKAALVSETNAASAVEFAKQAADLSPKIGNITTVAMYAEQAGDTATAIDYYQRALTIVSDETDATANPASYSKAYYENKLQALRAA